MAKRFCRSRWICATYSVEGLAKLSAPWNEIDLLLNNAGLAPPTDPLPDTDWNRIDEVIETNVTGLVALHASASSSVGERDRSLIFPRSLRLVYKARPFMRERERSFWQFSLDLRSDLEGSGVRVTSVEPGMAETEFTIVRTGGDEEASKKLYSGMNPITPEGVAELFWWLANLPAHLNVNILELMPVSQSFAGFKIARD